MKLMGQLPEDERRSFVKAIYPSLFRSDPFLARHEIDSYPKGIGPLQAITSGARLSAYGDLEKAAALIDMLPGVRARESGYRTLAEARASSSPLGAAKWAASRPDPFARRSAIAATVQSWLQKFPAETVGYRETGALSWPDVRRMEPGRPIWELMNVPFRNEPEFESGQIVVNKSLCWEPLNLAMWMNEKGRAECIYKIIWGDKDTFRFAWHKFGFPFAMTQVPLQMLTVAGGSCCIGVMCQHDLDGERIFQHRNMLKWELFAENPWVPGFLFEGECREFLAELRAKWDGRIGQPPMRLQGRAMKWARTLVEKVWLLEVKGKAAQGSAPPPGSQDVPQPGTLPTAMPSGGLIEPIGVGTGGLATRHMDPWPIARQRGFREVRS